MSETVRMVVATHMNAQVRKSGARKAIDISLRIDVPADIAAATDGEAPVVLKTKHIELGKPVAREYRAFDGRLFEPVVFVPKDTPACQGSVVGTARFQELLSGGSEPANWRNPFATSEEKFVSPNAKKPVATKDLPHERDAGFKEVVSEDRTRRLAEVARAAANFLVVDGVVHRECMAPRWVIRFTDKRKLSMVAETSPTWPSIDSFSIDRIGEAYSYLAQKTKHLRTSAEVKLGPKEVDEAGLPIGDALSLSGCSVEGEVAPSCSDAVAVAAAYGDLLAHETGPFLGPLPRPAVDPWIEARDTARALEPFDDVRAGVVLAAANEFNEIIRDHELNAADDKKRQDYFRNVVSVVGIRLAFEDVPQPDVVPDLGDIGEFKP